MNNSKDGIEKLKILLNDLEFMQNHIFEIIEKMKFYCEQEEEIMKLYAIDFNNSVSDLNLHYKNILKLCVELYWAKPSYILAPRHKNIEWD